MFQSFFPQPKLFFSSLALWSGILILVWYSFGKTIGEFLGFDLAETETVIGLGHFITSEFYGLIHFLLLGLWHFSLCGVRVAYTSGKFGRFWALHC